MARLYDISPPIDDRLAVFPGDTPVSRQMLLDMGRGDHLTLSTLRATVHLGAHVDGANHYGRGAGGVDAWPIERFVGPCQVMGVDAPPRHRITIADLPAPVTEARVLLRTGTYPDPTRWTDEFAALDPALVDELGASGVELVGIDTPSVDLADAKTLRAHHRFLANEMTILEGLVLDDVPDGRYELIALPLRLNGFDASPVRAVLRSTSE